MSTTQQETSTSPTTFAPLRPPRRYLFGPGPSMVHPYQALSQPIVGHLDPYLFPVMEDIGQLLNQFSAPGTAGAW